MLRPLPSRWTWQSPPPAAIGQLRLLMQPPASALPSLPSGPLPRRRMRSLWRRTRQPPPRAEIGVPGRRSAPAAPAPPVWAERPAAPPPHAVALATDAPAEAAASGPSLARLNQLGRITPELEARLREASFDGGASSSLVVLAGGRQTDVARPAPDRHERWEIR